MASVTSSDKRWHWPHVERNKQPIVTELARLIPPGATVLEIGCGSGAHAPFFVETLDVSWQPTDPSEEALVSARAWREHSGNPRVLEPQRLDVTAADWDTAPVDVVYAANVIHIAPWQVAEGLVRGAQRYLKAGGLLITYGPYRVGGAHTAESNSAFDTRLKSQNPEWGVRDLEALEQLGRAHELVLEERVSMPANNFLLMFRRHGLAD